MGEISLCNMKRSLCPDGFLHQMLTASGHAALSTAGGANPFELLWHWILHLAKRGLGSALLWDPIKRCQKSLMPQSPVCCEGTVWGQGSAECQGRCELPGVCQVWLGTLSKLGPADQLTLSLQSGKETAEKSNHLLCLYLALECFVWRQHNENHPKEVLCWWENYERPKKGVIK